MGIRRECAAPRHHGEATLGGAISKRSNGRPGYDVGMKKRGFVVLGVAFSSMVGVLASCVGDDASTAPGGTTTPDGAAPGNDSSTQTQTDSSTIVDGGTDSAEAAAPVCDASPCVVQISAGGAHSCARMLDGTVRCWGANGFGEVGAGTVVPGAVSPYKDDAVTPATYATPTAVVGVAGATVAGTGGSYRASGVSCVGTAAGAMKCWGIDSWLQLGRGDSAGAELLPRPARPVPVDVVMLSNVVDISVGINHVCAVIKLGSVACWGSDYLYQLGIAPGGAEERHGQPETVPVTANVKRVVSRGHHNLALTTAGAVWGWGDNANGELAKAATASAPPAALAALAGTYVDVAMGRFHGCALDSTGKVFCFGKGTDGQLGRLDKAATASEPDPSLVTFVAGSIVKQIAGDEQHMVALLDDGSVYEWGTMIIGASGDTRGTTIAVPTLVALTGRAIQVAAGYEHSCALLEGGSLQCWGNNRSGELGRGTTGGIFLAPAPVVF